MVHALHDEVLCGVVRVLLRGNLEHRRHEFVVVVQQVPDVLRDVLVYQHDGHVRPRCQAPEGLFDLLDLRAFADDQKIRAARVAVADACQQEARDLSMVESR